MNTLHLGGVLPFYYRVEGMHKAQGDSADSGSAPVRLQLESGADNAPPETFAEILERTKANY